AFLGATRGRKPARLGPARPSAQSPVRSGVACEHRFDARQSFPDLSSYDSGLLVVHGREPSMCGADVFDALTTIGKFFGPISEFIRAGRARSEHTLERGVKVETPAPGQREPIEGVVYVQDLTQAMNGQHR